MIRNTGQGMQAYRLSQLVATFGGELRGDDVEISQVAPLESAVAGQISFLSNPRYRKQLADTHAAAVIVAADVADLTALPAIVCADPYLYFAKVSALLNPPQRFAAGIDPGAVVAPDAEIAASAAIMANASVGSGARIGERCVIFPGVVIGDGVVVGDDTRIYANATVYAACVIGQRCTIHSGAVIGADGFGLAWNKDSWLKIPQIGRVVIGDDVDIGANTTIDRGALDDTVIEDGARLDNQIQVAHNCRIGKHTAIAGCVGMAGSTRIGAYCTVGGAAMFVGHIDIADKVHIAGGTLVSKSINKPGAYAGNYPFSTRDDWLQNAVHIRNLDKLAERIKQLEKKLAGLEGNKHD